MANNLFILPISDAGGLDLDGVLSGNTPQTGDAYAAVGALNDLSAADILTTALTEAYSTAGGTVTLSQFVYHALSLLEEKAVSGATLTANKRDGSTPAATYTLDDATSPTSITRAS